MDPIQQQFGRNIFTGRGYTKEEIQKRRADARACDKPEEIHRPSMSVTDAMRLIAHEIMGYGDWAKADRYFYYAGTDLILEIKARALAAYDIWLSDEQAKRIRHFCQKLSKSQRVTQHELNQLEE